MKKIILTQNKLTLIDNRNFKWLHQYNWCVSSADNTYYVVRGITTQTQNIKENIKQKQKLILMHREIVERKLGRKLNNNEEVDHINGNGLDNREYNLRICNSSQNKMNRKKQKRKTSSIYKGVSWNRPNKKWTAQLKYKRKKIHLGCFKNEVDAAITYNEAAIKYFGEFANLNKV